MSTTTTTDELVMKLGTNKMELLEFEIDRDDGEGGVTKGIYGINVSKVTEVIRMPEITEVPNMPPFVLGIIYLRGKTIPVVNLPKWLGIPEAKRAAEDKKVIVTEFNNTLLGFVVHQTTKIRRIPWEEINVPPAIMNEQYDGNITGTTMIEGDRILLILDLENILAELTPAAEKSIEDIKEVKAQTGAKKKILVVDDSLVARKQVATALGKAGYEVELLVDGKKAWERLNEIYREVEGSEGSLRDAAYLVLSDVEMPEMDGYTLTRKIKEDPRFQEIPVVLHSSLSGQSNIQKGEQVGCDHYVVKFDPTLLLQAVSRF